MTRSAVMSAFRSRARIISAINYRGWVKRSISSEASDPLRGSRPTAKVDTLIAAVARSQQDGLVTDNTRHFENISNLTLENWLPTKKHY